MAPKYEETFELITYRFTPWEGSVSSGNNTLQESQYNLQYEEFNWKNVLIHDWLSRPAGTLFSREITHFSALFHRNVYFQLCVRLTFCQIRSHGPIVRKYINFSNGFLFDHSFRKRNGIIRRMKIIKCGMKENNNFSPFNGSLGHSVVWLSWRFIVSHLFVIILYSNEIHFFAITSWFWWFRLFKTSKIIE